MQATTEAKYANITWAMFIGGSSSEATMALGAIANHYYNLTMVCVCVCVRAFVRVIVCVCVHACMCVCARPVHEPSLYA